ncbi:MAG: carbohydrate porin, partial [Myxococcales bacterium]|nr:carbohydrate porin [Myxococcales bacterium]
MDHHPTRLKQFRPMRGLSFTLVALIAILGNPATDALFAATTPTYKPQFLFGSYGRVSFGSNLRGGQGRPATVTIHAPRLLEKPYLELDFAYLQPLGSTDRGFRTAVTVAFSEDLFHYNGKFEAKIALRNLYAEMFNLLAKGLRIWVGSRMYRGDDVYLFDFWPLDNLNTLGAGLSYERAAYRVALHVGTNRLKDDFQLQEVESPIEPIGSQTVVFMDRQRWIGSLKFTYEPKRPDRSLGYKISGYGEFHFLPSGKFRLENRDTESLPRDLGYTIGAQFGIWGYGRKGSFTNLFVRYSAGLAAYGELAVPFGLDSQKKTTSAKELMIALSTNYESRWIGVMAGAWVRYFKDADPNREDLDDGWEGS